MSGSHLWLHSSWSCCARGSLGSSFCPCRVLCSSFFIQLSSLVFLFVGPPHPHTAVDFSELCISYVRPCAGSVVRSARAGPLPLWPLRPPPSPPLTVGDSLVSLGFVLLFAQMSRCAYASLRPFLVEE